MNQPQIPIYRYPARAREKAKPYILAAALGLVAGAVSIGFMVLRRRG
jgi:hypothetical protein